MTVTELRNELAIGFTDYEFVAKGKRGSICLFNREGGSFSATVNWGGFDKEFDSLDDLMSEPFLDGHSLSEVAGEIELYG